MRHWVALLLVCALAGCSSERVGGVPAPPSNVASSGGPVDLQVPLDLSRVTPEGTVAPTTSVLPDPDGAQLNLEPPFLTVTRLEDAYIQFQEYDAAWGLMLRMTDADAEVFGDWTSKHIGEQVAVVANREVIFAPHIWDAITTGDVTISAQYSQQEADDLLAQLTGRR